MLTYLRDMFLHSVLFLECNVHESTVVLYRTVQQPYSCLIPYCNMLICDPHGIAHDFFNHFGRYLINFYVYQDMYTLALIVKYMRKVHGGETIGSFGN